MMDSVMVNIGAAFMLIGGVALMAIVLGLAVYAAGLAWVAASDKWRDILRAESLIYEYRMNRDAYIKWRRNANKTIDSSTSVTRCKDYKHSTLPSELTQQYGKPGTLTCHNMHAPSNRRNVGSNDFCNYGEPKEATAMRTEEKGNG